MAALLGRLYQVVPPVNSAVGVAREEGKGKSLQLGVRPFLCQNNAQI